MSFSIETLQDFVMNLINDEAAKAAYAADPLGALKDAGLADLTPEDVQEVLPLVADNLPAGLPTDLSDLPVDLPVDDLPLDIPGLGDLPVGVPGLDLPGLPDLSDGLPGLPDLGDGLPGLPDLGDGLPHLPELGDGLPGLGDLPVELPSLPVDVPALHDIETPLGDLSAGIDPETTAIAGELDGDLIYTATSGLLSNPEDSDAPTVSTYTSTAFGEFAAGGKLDPEEFGGSASASTDAADAGLGLVGHSNGNVAAWGAVDTVVGDLGAGFNSSTDGVAFAAESPLGDIAANSDGEFSIDPVDTSDLLDVDHLGHTGDAVAGTVTHYVATGTEVLTDGIDGGADTLAGYLTGPVAPLGDAVETGAGAVTGGIEAGGDALTSHLDSLPSVDDLPIDHLPELPQLPDLPEIDSSDLPIGDVTGHLPVDLPSLPVDLPDTSAVTDLVSHNPVTDAVHASAVGGLVEGVTGHLPQVADLPGDLDLGL